jgi:GTP-sensing pleiotropic transcriptional regulator CodY
MGKNRKMKKICKKMSKKLTGRKVKCKFASESFAYDFDNDCLEMDINYRDIVSSEREKFVTALFTNLGIHVKHPLTYTMLHELGHLITNEENDYNNDDFLQYEIDSMVLAKLVENNLLDWNDSMIEYYKMKLEKDANENALYLYQTFPKIVKKFDKKFCKLLPMVVT